MNAIAFLYIAILYQHHFIKDGMEEKVLGQNIKVCTRWNFLLCKKTYSIFFFSSYV